MGARPRAVARCRSALAIAVATAIVLAALPHAAAAPFPTLPLGDDRGFLGNLSAPTLSPGASGTIVLTVGNPLSVPVTATELTLEVYAMNAFPGNATGNVTVSSAPVLANGSSSGLSISIGVGTIAPGTVDPESVAVSTSASTPVAAFLVRSALSFSANGSAYRLESRGWFSAATWARATQSANGSATVNLTVLGVSGILPETAIDVTSSAFPYVLGGVLAAAFALIGLGAWFYFRRTQGSSSGMRSAEVETHAPRAFGSNRTSDGD